MSCSFRHEKRPISTRKEGAIHAKSVPLSRQKFLIDPVCAAVPSDQIIPPHTPHPDFFMTLVPTFRSVPVPGWLWKSPGGIGKGKEAWGGAKPGFLLPTAVIVAKPQCFHGS